MNSANSPKNNVDCQQISDNLSIRALQNCIETIRLQNESACFHFEDSRFILTGIFLGLTQVEKSTRVRMAKPRENPSQPFQSPSRQTSLCSQRCFAGPGFGHCVASPPDRRVLPAIKKEPPVFLAVQPSFFVKLRAQSLDRLIAAQSEKGSLACRLAKFFL